MVQPGEEPGVTGRPLDAARGAHVLVVDDDPSIRALLAATLVTDHVARLDEAADGLEAVAAAEAHPYDIIVMDLRMPNLDGIEATRGALRASPHSRVVGFTAEHNAAVCRAFLQAGAVECLSKDQHHELCVVVETLARQLPRGG
jgi:CheY-like chemotaxis protein